MSTAREFAVITPDYRVPGLILALLLLACLGALGVIGPPSQNDPTFWLVMAVAVIAPGLMVIAMLRRKVTLEGDSLRIVAGLNQTRVPVASLQPDQARIIDLDTGAGREYRLGIKTFGTSLPGYHAGHFRQLGGRKVFALVTDKRRVLVLPERDGRLLMLSLEKPQALLDALANRAR